MMKPRFKYALTALLVLWLANSPAVAGEKNALSIAMNGAIHAGIPVPAINRIMASRYSQHLAEEQVVEILQFLSRLTEKDVPLEPFVAKIDEGLAKRVDVERIMATMNRMLADYRFAMSLASGIHEKRDDTYVFGIKLFSDSLALGVERQELRRLTREHPQADIMQLAIAAELMAFLKWMEFSDVEMKSIVSSGLKAGGFTAEWRRLPNILQMALQRDLTRRQITETVAATLQSGKSIQSLLPALGFTGRNLTGRAADDVPAPVSPPK